MSIAKSFKASVFFLGLDTEYVAWCVLCHNKSQTYINVPILVLIP